MPRDSVQSDLQVYLRQINDVPLLTPSEERELGWRVVNDRDPEAKERMIKANLRLVIAIAKHFMNRGVLLADLIEEGNVGLIRAVEGFDPAQGTRFSTYAAWWIKQAIRRMLSNAVQPIHVPAYMVELIQRLRETSRQLEEKLHRPATPSELARAMRLPVRKINAIRRATKAFHSPGHAPTGADGEGVDFGEVLADPRMLSPDAAITRAEEFAQVLRLLDGINARDARIVRMRYGLEGQSPRTLKQIGSEIGLTRERVRQIEVETLQRLAQRLSEEDQLATAIANGFGRKAG